MKLRIEAYFLPSFRDHHFSIFPSNCRYKHFLLTYSSKQNEFEDADAIYTEEKAQLNELEERFATLESEYLIVVEERKTARAIREHRLRELARNDAATKFQRLWKEYRRRKALKAKKKKGTKKKADRK